MPDQRPYATLLAKGEDRRQRILAVAQRLLMRNGGRGTTLGQIAHEAGVRPAVLLHENLDPDAPLHGRFLRRYGSAVETVAEGIRRGQRAGRYRADVDPVVKATEIVAFLYGMETSWLLDPSIPLTEVFREYTSSLARQLLVSPTADRPATR